MGAGCPHGVWWLEKWFCSGLARLSAVPPRVAARGGKRSLFAKRRTPKAEASRRGNAGCLEARRLAALRCGEEIKCTQGHAKQALKCIPSHNQGLQPASTQDMQGPQPPYTHVTAPGQSHPLSSDLPTRPQPALGA